MHTLNVPEPQILLQTRPSLVSGNGDGDFNPNLTDRTGAMGFAPADTFEPASEYRNGVAFQVPVKDEPDYQGPAQHDG